MPAEYNMLQIVGSGLREISGIAGLPRRYFSSVIAAASTNVVAPCGLLRRQLPFTHKRDIRNESPPTDFPCVAERGHHGSGAGFDAHKLRDAISLHRRLG